MKSENLNFLEPSGPLQACNGSALPFSSCLLGNLPADGKIWLKNGSVTESDDNILTIVYWNGDLSICIYDSTMKDDSVVMGYLYLMSFWNKFTLLPPQVESV